MLIYKDKFGTKTSTEIEAIITEVNDYLNNGSKTPYLKKCESKRMYNLRARFENLFTEKCEDGFRIQSQDVVGYYFGDILA